MKFAILGLVLALAQGLYTPEDDVVDLGADTFETSVLESGDVWFVEFYAPWCGHCKSLVPEYKTLATALKGIAKVGAVDATEHQSVGQPYGVTGFPTIKVFSVDKKEPLDYSGDRTAKKMAAFALKEVKEVVRSRLGIKKTAGKKKPKEPSAVVEATSASWEEDVLQAEGLVLVEFYAPWCGHCKNLAPEWKKAAKELQPKGIKLVAVDATVHGDLAAKYDVSGYPTIKVFTEAGDVEDFTGGRTSSAIVQWALQKTGQKTESAEEETEEQGPTKVVVLTSETFEEEVVQSDDLWMIEFYAPWCGHCKKLAPEWDAASIELEGKVKLGKVDCDTQNGVCGQYDVASFPTIKIFGSDRTSPEDGNNRLAKGIVSEGLEALEEMKREPRAVRQLTTPEVWEEECSSSTCLVAFLPHILDTGAGGREAYLNIFREQATKLKKVQVGFVWAEAMQQADLESTLGAGGTGYPALHAVRAKKGLNIPFFGGFDAQSIDNFIKRVLAGKERPIKLGKATLKVVASPAWDGKDGEAPKEEL